MKKARIIPFGDPVLREQAKPVTVFHKKLHALVDTMKHTLASTEEGAALAANQIAVPKRIVVIDYLDEYHEMINPEITEQSGESTDFEGCLSLPGYSGKVTRSERVKVAFHDRHGKEACIERTGRMARCIQHEIDHLNGILFIDRMDDAYVVNDENKKLPVKELMKLTAKR